MTKELLSQITNNELRDQLEAKEQMIKELKVLLMEANLHLKASYPFLYGDLIEKIEEVLK